MAETHEVRDPLPEQFETFEALADFWDTHDVTEYAEFLTPVEFEVTAQPTHEYEQRHRDAIATDAVATE